MAYIIGYALLSSALNSRNSLSELNLGNLIIAQSNSKASSSFSSVSTSQSLKSEIGNDHGVLGLTI